MPASDRLSRTRNGLRPPVVSTQAEKGMRSSEPDSAGMAIRKPTAMGDRCIASWKRPAVGPNRATAAKPTKNPRVAPKSPWAGVPFTGCMARSPQDPARAVRGRPYQRTTCGLRQRYGFGTTSMCTSRVNGKNPITSQALTKMELHHPRQRGHGAQVRAELDQRPESTGAATAANHDEPQGWNTAVYRPVTT